MEGVTKRSAELTGLPTLLGCKPGETNVSLSMFREDQADGLGMTDSMDI